MTTPEPARSAAEPPADPRPDKLYSFDLNAADYVEMCLHSCDGFRAYLAPAARRAGVWALCALLLADRFLDGDFRTALFVACGVGAVAFAVLPLRWRYVSRKSVRAYYADTSLEPLMGPNTLLLTADGLESIGPNHRSTRTWRMVTRVCETESLILLTTLFDTVVILPKRAVDSVEEALGDLRARLPGVEFRRPKRR